MKEACDYCTPDPASAHPPPPGRRKRQAGGAPGGPGGPEARCPETTPTSCAALTTTTSTGDQADSKPTATKSGNIIQLSTSNYYKLNHFYYV